MEVLTESVVEEIVGFAADVTKRWRYWFVSHCSGRAMILVLEKLNVT